MIEQRHNTGRYVWNNKVDRERVKRTWHVAWLTLTVIATILVVAVLTANI